MNEDNNIDTFKRIIEKNTLLLMYEPGAGGDFVASLLSVDPKLHGSNSNISYHDNGRIKAMETPHDIEISKIVNDYEFYENDSYFDTFSEQLLLNILNATVSTHSNYISKLHPYLTTDKNVIKLSNHIAKNYQRSSKIMLVRDHVFTAKNHRQKNNSAVTEMYYSSHWNQRFDILKQNFPDICTINFSDVVKNPILSLKKIYHVMGYSTEQVQHNLSINTETIKHIYMTYMTNQQNLEDVKRYWE